MDNKRIYECLNVLDISAKDIISPKTISEQYEIKEKLYRPDIAPNAYKDGKKYEEIKAARKYLLENLDGVNLLIRIDNGENILENIKSALEKYQTICKSLSASEKIDADLLKEIAAEYKNTVLCISSLVNDETGLEYYNATGKATEELINNVESAVSTDDCLDFCSLIYKQKLSSETRQFLKQKINDLENLKAARKKDEDNQRKLKIQKEKHEEKRAKENTKVLLRLDKKLHSLGDYSTQLNCAYKAINDSYLQAVNRKLNNTPIESLNNHKQGIKVSYLRNAGYYTLADIYKVRQSELVKISGIGNRSAALISKASDELYRDIKNNTQVVIPTHTRDAKLDDVISTLYLLKIHREVSSESKKYYLETHDQIVSLTNDAKTATGIAIGKANAEKKKQARYAIKEIENLVYGDYTKTVETYLRKINDAEKSDITQQWNDCFNHLNEYKELLNEALNNGKTIVGLNVKGKIKFNKKTAVTISAVASLICASVFIPKLSKGADNNNVIDVNELVSDLEEIRPESGYVYIDTYPDKPSKGIFKNTLTEDVIVSCYYPKDKKTAIEFYLRAGDNITLDMPYATLTIYVYDSEKCELIDTIDAIPFTILEKINVMIE